jgi:hypothetical protein
VQAQVQEETTGLTPIPLGSVQLFPAYRLDVSWTDNLFYDNANLDPVSTYAMSMTPSLLFELPVSKSRTRLGYAYRYRAYSADVEQNDAHYALLDLAFELSSGVKLTLRDDFQTGVLDTKTFDPGGAEVYKGERVDSHLTSAGFGYASRRWELGVRATNTYVFFPERRLTSFYDVDGWGAALFGRYQSSPVLGFSFEFAHDRTRLEIPSSGSFPGEVRIEITQGADVGADWDLAPGSRLSFRVGYPQYEYVSDQPTTFRTVTGQVEYSRGVPAGWIVSGLLSRSAYPSTFLDNNYYVDDRLRISVRRDREARLDLGGAVTYYWNRYPEPIPPAIFPDQLLGGPPRDDQTLNGEAWIGYRFSGGLVWRVYVSGETRWSNVKLYEYGVGSVGTTFVLGG